ncbi:MAG TPA: metalloregulator ArsR/SmtB family transcription factor [Desulfuromonadaceae bacterium]
MSINYEDQARVFSAFCDEKRLKILDLLKNGEKCACVLTPQLGIAQSTLSYHMKILCEAGIVESREEGKWTHYSISREGGGLALSMLREIVSCPAAVTDGCCSEQPTAESKFTGAYYQF